MIAMILPKPGVFVGGVVGSWAGVVADDSATGVTESVGDAVITVGFGLGVGVSVVVCTVVLMVVTGVARIVVGTLTLIRGFCSWLPIIVCVLTVFPVAG